MRFLILLCLVAATYADKLGYNYQPVPHAEDGLSFQPGAGLGADVSSGEAILSPAQEAPSGAGGVGPASAAGPSSIGGPAAALSAAPAPSLDSGSIAPATEFQKEFYTYSAPEGDFDDGQAAEDAANSLKQNLRVIFIRTPENRGLENAALQLARSAANEQTAIYVLARQPDLGSLANQLQNLRSQNSQKPEVHFVKYRTPEDAANAQQAIQSQYDTLGGSSQSHNGGVAPVLNFASQAPQSAQPAQSAAGNGAGAPSSAQSAPAGPGAQYLPANPLPPVAQPSQSYLPASLRRFRL